MKKIFLLHGWTYSLAAWQPFLVLMEKKGYPIKALQIPGLTATIDREWTLQDYVEWLEKITHKEKEKPVIIAHSNGGRIAIAFAAQYPQLLSYLILIDSAGVYHNEFPLRIKRFFFEKIAKGGKKIFNSNKIRALFYKLIGEHDYEKAPSLYVRQTMINLITSNTTPFISRVHVPTEIIWGQDDTITPLKDGERMKELILNSTFRVIPEARHSPYKTHPEKLAELISMALDTL